jgi:hypothetical protein
VRIGKTTFPGIDERWRGPHRPPYPLRAFPGGRRREDQAYVGLAEPVEGEEHHTIDGDRCGSLQCIEVEDEAQARGSGDAVEQLCDRMRGVATGDT